MSSVGSGQHGTRRREGRACRHLASAIILQAKVSIDAVK